MSDVINQNTPIDAIAEKIQTAINRLAVASGNMLLLKAARGLGRTDVQFIKTDVENVEMYCTMSFKPDSDGLFTVVRNGKIIQVKANQGESADIIPVNFSFEIYGKTETNLNGKVSRKVSKTTIRKFVAFILKDESGDLKVAMMRYNTKESLWENAKLPNAINRADFTEDDLRLIVAEKLVSFLNRLENGNAIEKQRTPVYKGKQTLYGQFKAQ